VPVGAGPVPVGAGPVPVGAGRCRLVPVGAGWCRSVPVGAGRCRCRCRYSPVPPGAGAADRPQETLYIKINDTQQILNFPLYPFRELA
jgi:hypothetical protein